MNYFASDLIGSVKFSEKSVAIIHAFMFIMTPMKLIKPWHAGSFRSFMPTPTQYLAIALGLGISFGAAKAQTSFDVSNQSGNLGLSTSWTPAHSGGQTPPPSGNDGAVWDSNSVTTINQPLIDSFTSGSGTLGSITLNKWVGTVLINTNGAAPNPTSLVTLVGNPAINTTSVGLDIGNLNIDPLVNSGATFNLDNQMTVTGALGTSIGNNTTITVNDGGPLNLIGQSNAGATNGATSGKVNLTFQNNSNLTLGNNSTKSFGELTINGNTSLTQDNFSAVSNNNKNNNTDFAITTKTQATFTGGLNIEAGRLTIYGWQGPALGATSSGEQLLFSNVDPNTSLPLVTGVALTDVIFDLATNQAGPTGSPFDPADGSQYDYGMWITDPSNSSLDELVPYACVPEPASILGALVLLGALVYRERRRLAAFGFYSQPENCL